MDDEVAESNMGKGGRGKKRKSKVRGRFRVH